MPARFAAKVPVPRGLKPCTADGLSASGMERMAAALGGEPLGCFQSSATTELHGAGKNLTRPAEFAFAVGTKGGPYTATDVAKLMSDVSEGWKSAKPLSQETRAEYERRLDELIEKNAPTGSPKPADSTHPAVLVSIEQLGPEAFSVVAIRQSPLSLNGEYFNITKVDAAAVVLRAAALMRLSIARELRSKQDVEATREEIADWAYAVASGP
ncbi:MAG: hypothetical protein WBF21_05115 [Steroidobacteraceae bacterium]